jgi:N-acyl homoserine lactone hydrolase
MKIHHIQTGTVTIKEAQRVGSGKYTITRFLNMLTDREWTEELPIYSWVIEHPEGIIVIDSGETARTGTPGYFPGWHPYYRLGLKESVQSWQEVGPQLERLGIPPQEVRWLILTHLHTDHAGGIYHFPSSKIILTRNEYERASGLGGRLRGYLPQHRPSWFQPELIDFKEQAIGPFPHSMPLTSSGDVTLVSTPGHTPGHLSVAVWEEDRILFFAGDTSYTQDLMLAGKVDGVAPDAEIASRTLDLIRQWAQEEDLIYLPSHDPQSAHRLGQRIPVSANTPEEEKLSA